MKTRVQRRRDARSDVRSTEVPGSNNSAQLNVTLRGAAVFYDGVQCHPLLAENNESNPSEIARAVGRSVRRVSTVLGVLRLAEVVRYDTDEKRNRYRLTHPSEVRSLLGALSRFVKVASVVGRECRTTAAHFHVSGIPETWKSVSEMGRVNTQTARS